MKIVRTVQADSHTRRRTETASSAHLLAAALGLLGCSLSAAQAAAGAPAADASAYARKWTRSELEETLKISKEWLGNTLGKDEVAPPPWTPMTAAGQSVGCWG